VYYEKGHFMDQVQTRTDPAGRESGKEYAVVQLEEKTDGEKIILMLFTCT
jgi:hypothetical protein